MASRQRPGVAGLLLLALLALAHGHSAIQVRLTVNGQSRELRTRAGTVGRLLQEAGLELAPGDRVHPRVAQRLRDGSVVRVQQARIWRVLADGGWVTVRSLAGNAAGVLAEAGIQARPGDRVLLDGRALAMDGALPPRGWPTGAARLASVIGEERPARVALAAELEALPTAVAAEAAASPRLELLRAQAFTVTEDGLSLPFRAAGITVAEALASAGLTVDVDDVVAPGREARFRPGMTIAVSRATSLQVEADGQVRQARVSAATVGQALTRLGLGLGGLDYSVPEAGTALSPGMTVKVVRVRRDVQLQEEEIPFETESRVDAEVPLGERIVEREGSPGLKSLRIALTYENGNLIDRQVEEEKVLREPVSAQVVMGSKVVWRVVETEAGPMRYFARFRVYATSYSAARAGTPKSAPWYGFTRSGLKMRRGIVAVDRSLIPLGTNLYVPGYGVGLAGDTGGGIRNFHIDLGYDDDNYVSWHQWVELYLLEPVPSGIDVSRLIR